VSRFVNKDATQPVDLGPCQCPNKPHERDEALVRSELGYLEILAISAANSAEDVADTFTADASPFDGHPVIVSWNLEDERGPVEVTAIALGPKRIRRSLGEWFTGERIPEPPAAESGSAEALTYDALLTLRGWGRDEFATATAEMVTAARAALFAERLAPLLAETVETLAVDPSNVEPQHRPQVNRARREAAKQRDAIRAALGMTDDG
jgi:hypothetical protein